MTFSAYPTTFLVSDRRGRPTVRTDNPNKVILLMEQGFTATRAIPFSDEVSPVEPGTLRWVPDETIMEGRRRRQDEQILSTIKGRIDARLGLGTRD